MVAEWKNPVLRLPANELGRDLVVGDIHGCFDLLWDALDRVRFDPTRDRVLSVGDMVDRGPDSAGVLDFLCHPWALAVRGNHEDMLLAAHEDSSTGLGGMFRRSRSMGGAWWSDADDDTRSEILTAFAALPIAIDVGDGQFGVVHGDVPPKMAWGDFLTALEDGFEDVPWTAIWGRERVQGENAAGVDGINQVFVGHTRVPQPLILGNVWAIDTGAVYGVSGHWPHGALTVVQAGIAVEEMLVDQKATRRVRVIVAL
jgi:serine/threonine protein phosphatase 1